MDDNESEEENVAKVLKERSKKKLKVNDNRNRINNRRIAKDVDDVPTEGVEFCSEEHKARWKLVCVMNILPERILFDVTYNNQTYINILQDVGLLGTLSEIGPYWPQMVREYRLKR
ncbi:hypothetical protein LIER_40230 [Lithospermum erythrorhizon]|uniref:Uncharacterized protein n=1 Tax=Lithospermum erythrorhizon TaxID=34254 RepID=A0AAV3QVJ1_LITER